MVPRRSRIRVSIAIVIAAPMAFIVLAANDAFVREVWTRESPLDHPCVVARVQNGIITLVDGRAFRPAGVRCRDGLSQAEFDNALRVIVAQGVIVLRDVGEGRAFLMAEPRFYNWCGTHDVFTHWAGAFIQCPVSELLIQTAYADRNPDEQGLTPREAWRLEGVAQLRREGPTPVRIAERLNAFRYDGQERMLRDCDDLLQAIWRPPPP